VGRERAQGHHHDPAPYLTGDIAREQAARAAHREVAAERAEPGRDRGQRGGEQRRHQVVRHAGEPQLRPPAPPERETMGRDDGQGQARS